jgi:hypothetical protein
MNRIAFFATFFTLLLSSCSHRLIKRNTVSVIELDTESIYEPSGLTFRNGTFYTVSDKHNKIFTLDFSDSKVSLKPYLSLTFKNASNKDFEGIDFDGRFF